jgi:trimeric autotransporter adhesin
MAPANAYFAADVWNVVFRVDAATGELTRFAGNGTAGYSGDNGPATSAELNGVMGVAADAAGNVYIADTQNNRIRKVSNGVITTIAGNGFLGYSGDGGPATSARLNQPFGVAVDASGNVYIADSENYVVRKVSNGVITTFAGNGTNPAAFLRRQRPGPQRGVGPAL